MDQFWIRPLAQLRGTDRLVRKGTYGNRMETPLTLKYGSLLSSRGVLRKSPVRQPSDCDVVEDISPVRPAAFPEKTREISA